MKDLVEETSDLEGLEVFTLLPLDMGFVELNAPTETQIKDLDKHFFSRLISFCEKKEVRKIYT